MVKLLYDAFGNPIQVESYADLEEKVVELQEVIQTLTRGAKDYEARIRALKRKSRQVAKQHRRDLGVLTKQVDAAKQDTIDAETRYEQAARKIASVAKVNKILKAKIAKQKKELEYILIKQTEEN